MIRSNLTFGNRNLKNEVCSVEKSELQVGIWSYGFRSWEIWKSQLRPIQDPATAATSINSRTAGWSMLINWWLVASIKHEHALTYMQNLNERWAETFGFERVEKSLTLSLFLMNIHSTAHRESCCFSSKFASVWISMWCGRPTQIPYLLPRRTRLADVAHRTITIT